MQVRKTFYSNYAAQNNSLDIKKHKDNFWRLLHSTLVLKYLFNVQKWSKTRVNKQVIFYAYLNSSTKSAPGFMKFYFCKYFHLLNIIM